MKIRAEPKRSLSPKHLSDLQASGLTQEQISIAGHFSVDTTEANKFTGYELPGLLFSYHDPDGQPYLRADGRPFYRIKPDWSELKGEDAPKYLSPKNQGCRPYFSRLCRDWRKVAQSTKIDLWETEGEKKGDSACANGFIAIAFAGVDAWVDRFDRDVGKELDESRELPELSEVDWRNRRVNQCFDSDIIEKLPVQNALAKRAFSLRRQGAIAYLVLLPNELDGAKNGLDDFLVRHGSEALRLLAEHSSPTVFKAEKDQLEGEKTISAITLVLKEPDSHYKSLMAWSVMKEIWAYRPGAGWYEWQRTHWKLSSLDEFEQVLTRFMDAQHWKNRNSSHITSIIRELRSRLLVRDEVWQSCSKVAFSNGTLNVETGQFIPAHNPEDCLTRLRPYPFDLAAQCPTWLKFTEEAMEQDLERIKLIQALFRHAVLPRAKDRKAEIEKSFDFFGPKGTGKGTVLDTLTNLVGFENVGSASVDTFKSAVGLGQLVTTQAKSAEF